MSELKSGVVNGHLSFFGRHLDRKGFKLGGGDSNYDWKLGCGARFEVLA